MAKIQSYATDSSTYKDVLVSSEEEQKVWNEAMVSELKSVVNLRSFKMVNVPREANVLESTWVFKKKRYIDGELRKFNIRFCVWGDQHIDGVDVFDTYAPVVTCITVMLLLVMPMLLNL